MKAIMVLVGGLVLTSALAPPAHADDVKLYFDKAAFIADTGATSATGPLPDVGIMLDADVDPPVSTYTLGSVTFGLTLGSDNVFIGAAGTPAACRIGTRRRRGTTWRSGGSASRSRPPARCTRSASTSSSRM